MQSTEKALIYVQSKKEFTMKKKPASGFKKLKKETREIFEKNLAGDIKHNKTPTTPSFKGGHSRGRSGQGG
jgi:hypothetical protein